MALKVYKNCLKTLAYKTRQQIQAWKVDIKMDLKEI